MYLRGLGLGLIVAALVLSLCTKVENRTLSDAEIRSRAKELGMVDESTTLKGTEEKKAEETEAEEPEDTKTEEAVNEPEEAKPNDEQAVVEEVKKPEEKAESVDEAKKTEEVAKTEELTKETDEQVAEEAKKPAEEVKKTEETEKPQVVVNKKGLNTPYNLRIEGGYSSDRVAKILEGAGVIDSAASFDKYLCSNGYDHRISTGSYTIPAGADFATIAKMITHSN